MGSLHVGSECLRGYANKLGLLVSSGVILLSFTMSGHSQLGGFQYNHFCSYIYWYSSGLVRFAISLDVSAIDPHNLSIVAHHFGVFAIGYVGLLIGVGLRCIFSGKHFPSLQHYMGMYFLLRLRW